MQELARGPSYKVLVLAGVINVEDAFYRFRFYCMCGSVFLGSGISGTVVRRRRGDNRCKQGFDRDLVFKSL